MSNRRAQSAELGAGTGFTYEDAAGAYYLSALLSEGYGPGIENRVVSGVSFQQKAFGEPLDDLVVDFNGSSDDGATFSVQVKRSLTISAAASNDDFREVIQNAWLTYRKTDFRKNRDRVGGAVGEVAKDRARALVSLCEAARESIETDHFMARFAGGGSASAEVKEVKADIESILNNGADGKKSDADIHGFLANFVLVNFDFLHSGAIDSAEATTLLRNCLTAEHTDQAPNLWKSLCQTVRNSGGKSGHYDRARLVRELAPTFPLRASPSFRGDTERLSGLATDWLKDIGNDVGGAHLERKALKQSLAELLGQSRFIQVKGLPGSGKSAVLRQRLEDDLKLGPILFLKSDRLEGRGWASFAAHYGLSRAPLRDLLVEIGATGSKTLYIDGIDRIEKVHQPIALDVLREIFEAPLLDEWKVVVTLRDTGIEPLRNWLGDLLGKIGVLTLDVNALDDDEAEELAKAKPQLRALLFGPSNVQDIVRRPFFAKILEQAYGTATTTTTFEPQSEIDLIENWWSRGGYDASGQAAMDRQRALIDLAAAQARHVSQPIRLNELTAATTQRTDQLIGDGLIRSVRAGLTVRFGHDILFEWAFYYVLSDQGPDWLKAIRDCGEPPAVARTVELLSQYEYREGKTWAATLASIASSGMRAQWARAWLLGPVATDLFWKNEAQFEAAASANDFHFLRKALVWFQAEKTTPNPGILAGPLPRDEKIRMADLLGWPSDFASWRRLITFILRRLGSIPVRLYPEIVAVFDVWQNACAGIPNALSKAIVTNCATWLGEIDGRGTEEGAKKNKRWDAMKDSKEIRQSLVAIVMYGARTVPQPAQEYLERLIGQERLYDERFSEIVGFSPILAQTHPKLLVDLTLKHLKEELPDDKAARIERERSQRRGRGFSHLDFPQFSLHDMTRLCIDHDVHNFFPASPLREPFQSLFKTAPEHAIQLFRELCNHAMAAWRQLHRHVREYRPPGTPLPLVITFPWGVQEFWGGEREYIWYRGLGGPEAIECGFMALEAWCFAEIERGRPVDEVIKQIVEGNESVAILGVAALLAIHTTRVSETVFSLVTAQRLWALDHTRMVQEMSGMANLMGFTKKSDIPHAKAVQSANARPARKQQLRSLVQVYVLGEFRERTRAAILRFKDELPFQYEEHRNHEPARAYLTKQALEYAELADLNNYQVRKIPNSENLVEIQVVSPSAAEPENVAAREKATEYLQQQSAYVWASKAIDDGRIDDEAKVATALEFARNFDSSTLFIDATGDQDLEIRRGAVASVAAVVLTFRQSRTEAELSWAREILNRAEAAPDLRSNFWSPQSIIPWEPKLFVARGLGADFRHGTAENDAALELLALVAHPLEMASLAALQEAVKLWAVDPKLSWAAMHLAFELCRLVPRDKSEYRGPGDTIHSEEITQEALDAAISFYRDGSGWSELPVPPPAWTKSNEPRTHGYAGEDYDEDDLEEPAEDWVEPATHWYSQYAAKVLQIVPLDQIVRSEAKEPFLTFLGRVLEWTIAKNAPPWVKKGKRSKESSRLFEWNHLLGSTLGRLLGLLPLSETKTRFLDPVLALEDEVCWALLSPLVSGYIPRYVYDAASVPQDAISILGLCLDKFLQASAFKANNYHAGEFYGSGEPRLLETLMFVSIERADGAARFVNGNWSDIKLILPIVDRLVRAGGWSATVMYQFLVLCERAREHYPADVFADQILATLEDASVTLKGWSATSNAARIAGLVQHFASRETPMSLELGLKLLRILDLLVDMGDRRSAALELSEVFREIRVG